MNLMLCSCITWSVCFVVCVCSGGCEGAISKVALVRGFLVLARRSSAILEVWDLVTDKQLQNIDIASQFKYVVI